VALGEVVGPEVGPTVGPEVGPAVGPKVGELVGPPVGPDVGAEVGPEVGPANKGFVRNKMIQQGGMERCRQRTTTNNWCVPSYLKLGQK